MSNNPFHQCNELIFGTKPSHLLLCEKCNCRHSVSIIEPALPKMSWLTTLKCTKNDTHPSWSICKFCKVQFNQYTTPKQIKNHHYNKHNISKLK